MTDVVTKTRTFLDQRREEEADLVPKDWTRWAKWSSKTNEWTLHERYEPKKRER